MAVLVENQVHLPISEPPAVSLLGTFVYAYAVPDTRNLGFMPVPGLFILCRQFAASVLFLRVGGGQPCRFRQEHPLPTRRTTLTTVH